MHSTPRDEEYSTNKPSLSYTTKERGTLSATKQETPSLISEPNAPTYRCTTYRLNRNLPPLNQNPSSHQGHPRTHQSPIPKTPKTQKAIHSYEQSVSPH